MTVRSQLLASLAVLALALPRAWAEDKPQENALEPLARFVGGAWIGQGKHSKDDFRTRVVYEWGLNRKVLKAKSYLTGEKGEQLVYESVFFWHPGKKQIRFISVAAHGGIFDGAMEPKGDTIECVFESWSGDKATTYRQKIHFTDDDHTEWTVHVKKGNEWAPVIDSRQERKK